MQTMTKTLGFSEPFVKVDFTAGSVDFKIKGPEIIVNIGDEKLLIGDKPLQPRTSSIYSSVNASGSLKLIRIILDNDLFSGNYFPYKQAIKVKWTSLFDLTRNPEFKNVSLWRSVKESISGINFNLWFCEAGTDCGIHREHDFRELHSQIFGIGKLQKFHKQDHDTLYQDVFMCPGYTHEPFYDDRCLYPWHQYRAETDCLWLAIEF
jgi:hypothetical protein